MGGILDDLRVIELKGDLSRTSKGKNVSGESHLTKNGAQHKYYGDF